MKKAIIGVAGLIIVAFGVLVAAMFVKSYFGAKGYTLVSLTNNIIYVGKLKTFPSMVLTEPYLFTLVPDEKDQTKVNFQLTPLKEVVWATDAIKINPRQVNFSARLNESSKVVQTILGAKK